MEKYYRIAEAAYFLGVCSKTIRRWDASGRIKCARTPGGHRRISILEIERILSDVPSEYNHEYNREIAIYCRVSSHDQKKKGDLERQIEYSKEYCEQNHVTPLYIFNDVGSGLNTRRTGLKKLCRLIEEKKISKVILTYSDRLTRFGFNYLETYFKSHGTNIHVINKKPGCTMQEELVQDLIAIVTSFSGRVHGMRSHGKNKHSKKSRK